MATRASTNWRSMTGSNSMIFPTSVLIRAGIAQKAIPKFSSHHSPLFGSSKIQSRHFINRFFRPGPKTLGKAETPGVKRAYGERVLVYYAGRRIVFVATLKLATLFVFSFCSFIAAPSVGVNTEYGYLAPIGIIAAGAIPLVFMQYTSSPYVTHAYLHLPPWARQSRDMLLRYSRKLPPSAQLDLVTIRLLGRPQLRTVVLSELKYMPKRIGCANWEWRPVYEDAKKWRDFYVDQNGSPAKTPVPGIMDEVVALVKEQTKQNLLKSG